MVDTGPREKAWCLLIHAEASPSLSHSATIMVDDVAFIMCVTLPVVRAPELLLILVPADAHHHHGVGTGVVGRVVAPQVEIESKD